MNSNNNTHRVHLFGAVIDAVRMPDAVARLMGWIGQQDGNCRYVVTPNVDHAVILRKSEPMRRAYRDANMILADGMPVVLASRLLGRPLPERVTGADLVPALFDAASQQRPLRVFLLGAGPVVADCAAEKIHQRWPAVRVVGTYCPPLGFEHKESENRTILQRIAAAAPDVVVVGLGPPNRKSGFKPIATRSKPPRRCVWGPRSIFWPTKNLAPRNECGGPAWNGFIACSASPAGSPSGISMMPGSFRNSSGKNCGRLTEDSDKPDNGAIRTCDRIIG